MQSKKRSLYEAGFNIVVGLAYAFALNYFLLHMQWSSLESQAFWMTVWFTLGSFIRQYLMRRLFNWLDVKYPTAHFDTTWADNIGTITHGVISSNDGSFIFDLANNQIVITGDLEPLASDHVDDPCDDWGADLWDLQDWDDNYGQEF